MAHGVSDNREPDSVVKKETPTEGNISTAEAAAEFCKKFLGSKTLKAVNEELSQIEKKLTALSDIFRDVTTFKVNNPERNNGIVEIIGGEYRNELNIVTDVQRAICGVIEDGVKRGGDRERLLIINSPVGSYRNRLMKYVYLKMAKSPKIAALPVYIDASYYESHNDFDGDLEKISCILQNNGGHSTVLIIDNVRSFKCGMGRVYGKLNELFEETENCKLVVGVDCRFNEDMLEESQRELATNLVNKDATKLTLSISSMRLDIKEESPRFIEKCIAFFQSEFEGVGGRTIDPENVRKRLMDLGLIYIDAYWLMRLLKEYGTLTDQSTDIARLYQKIIEQQIYDDRIDEAAEVAYEFGVKGEYLEAPAEVWKMIREHKSVLDYFIAKRYVKLLERLNLDEFDNMTEEAKKKAFEFFNSVFPKSITRFATCMIEGNSELEEKLLKLATDRYYNDGSFFGTLAKSELTYWLGRLSDTVKNRAFNKLKELRKTALADYDEVKDCTESEKRDEAKRRAFLLRGINVSLLYFRNPTYTREVIEVLKDYLKLLFTDKVSNEVNRAFHLEYYNDIAYQLKANSDTCIKEMRDDVSKKRNTLAKGRNTFRKLIADLEERGEPFDCVCVLQLVTLCSLILARKPEKIDTDRRSGKKSCYVKNLGEVAADGSNEFLTIYNINDDIDKCYNLIEKLERESIYDYLDNLTKGYFDWMKKELKWLKAEFDNAQKQKGAYFISYIETRSYNMFAATQNIERTGWRQRGIARPESVADHMYNSWFMGLLYLPEKGVFDDEGTEYNKTSILNMLLIHDIGEVVTGDIPRDVKSDEKRYKDKESGVLYSLLLAGAYPFVSESMSNYCDEWEAWARGESINAKIAKDIDNIQATYQYCRFYLQRKGKNKPKKKEEKIDILDGNGKKVEDVPAVASVNMDEDDCFKWLAKSDPYRIGDGYEPKCELKSKRGREISKKIIFENSEFADIIRIYNKKKA